ncbi:MAG: hypothetical protein ACT4OY_05085 [Alphaproteobacteria bacterium]
MIEAVNSVVASVQVDRNAPAQTDAARAYAANPERVQEAAPVVQAPYVSPYIHVDVNYDKAVLQIRNPDTGDVLKQFPSETVLKARVQAEASRATRNQTSPVSFETADAAPSQQAQTEQQTFSLPEVSQPKAEVQTRSPQSEIASAAFIAASQTSQPNTSSVRVSA